MQSHFLLAPQKNFFIFFSLSSLNNTYTISLLKFLKLETTKYYSQSMCFLDLFYTYHSQSPNNGLLKYNGGIYPPRQSVFPSES